MTNDDVVWTGWLRNPGDGQCPVPEWHKGCVTRMNPNVPVDGVLDKKKQGYHPEIRVWESGGIQWYAYAIPADLAWLAENVDVWSEYRYWSAPDKERIGNEWRRTGRVLGWPEQGKPNEFEVFTKEQWLRAKKDLGYDTPQHNKEEPMNPSQTGKSVDQCRLEMLNSFYTAVLKAGGDPKTIIRMDMTLEEIIGALAQNGIRFSYDKSDSAGRK